MGPSMNWNQMTAVFGGTFDPPHLGHMHAVAGLFERPGVKRVVVLPSGTPPLKGLQLLDAQVRLALTRIAFGEDRQAIPALKNHEIEVSDFEIKQSSVQLGKRSNTPNYTIDTLMALGQIYGKNLAFVMGTDQLLQLHKWHRFPEVLGCAHWIVLNRNLNLAPQSAQNNHSVAHALSQLQGSGLLLPTAQPMKGAVSGGSSFEIRLPNSGPSQERRELLLVDTDAPALSSTTVREALSRVRAHESTGQRSGADSSHTSGTNSGSGTNNDLLEISNYLTPGVFTALKIALRLAVK